MNATARRHWQNSTYFYVAQLPGNGGKDWGYSERREDAIELSPYWQRRFLANCRFVGCRDYKLTPVSA